METLLTVKEVAERLKVRPMKVFNLIAGGAISAININRNMKFPDGRPYKNSYRITESDLEKFLQPTNQGK